MNRIVIINQGQTELCRSLSQKLDHCLVLDSFQWSLEPSDTICWLPADNLRVDLAVTDFCLLYTSPSPRDRTRSRMPSSA